MRSMHEVRKYGPSLGSVWVAPCCLLVVMFCLYAFTGLWPWHENFYNSYSLQADAWLHGRLDLGQDYPWLELAIYQGRYYVSFPPFPSYILLPLVAIMGVSTPDALLSLIASLVGIALAVRIATRLCGDGPVSLFYPLYLYLGTGYLFLAHTGWVWFFAQTLCFTLCLAAIDQAQLNHGGWSLTFWACAVGCRPLVVLFLPVLILLLRRHAAGEHIPAWICRRLYWAVGPVILAASYMLLNGLRFGNILEFGHTYLPEFMRAEHGQFSLTYLPEHLRMLFRLPYYDPESGRLIIDSVETTLLPLENPMYLSALIAWFLSISARRKSTFGSRYTLLIWIPLLLIIHMLISCMHRTLGAFQYGNRYFLDAIPFLYLGLLEWRRSDTRFDILQMPLCMLGFTLSILGTVCTYNAW